MKNNSLTLDKQKYSLTETKLLIAKIVFDYIS